MARRVSVVPATALREGLDAIRREVGVPERFPDDVVAEAAAARPPQYGRVELDFVTIDPPGARDLDQAMHIERRGDGHRVHYAIADPGAFITPGGALDRETHARAVTVYMPDGKIPLHPEMVIGRDGDDLLLSNYEGKMYRYPDPGGTTGQHVGESVR